MSVKIAKYALAYVILAMGLIWTETHFNEVKSTDTVQI